MTEAVSSTSSNSAAHQQTTASDDHVPPKGRRQRPQWREAVAGATAGALSKTCMAPLERIKLLKQLQGTTLKTNKSAWQLTQQVYQQEGLYSFWRGNLPSVLRTAGTAAVNFTCMDYYKNVAVQPLLQTAIVPRRRMTSTETIQRRRQFYTSLISGGLAGATSTTLLYPFEFVRTRLAMDVGRAPVAAPSTSTEKKQPPSSMQQKQRQQRQYRGMYHVVVSIFKADGIPGLYQGYGIALVGGVVYRILYLGGYDALKNEVALYRAKQQQHGQSHAPQSSSAASSSSSSSSLSWTDRIMAAQTISLTAGSLSYPFDSVRRRMMMQAGLDAAERRYRHSRHCIADVFKHEGIRGFYLGLAPNLMRSVGGALLLVAYDAVRTLL